METLYTIKHKIGSSASKYNEGETALYAYAQEAFALSNEDHQRFLDKASEEKVCRGEREKGIAEKENEHRRVSFSRRS